MDQKYKKILFPYINKDESVSWVVEFPDLPGCSAVGATEEEALLQAKDASELWLEEYYEQHNSYPVPRETRNEYSGKFMVRLPKSLHKSLVLEAEEEGVSLNSMVNTLLAQKFGERKAQRTINITINQPEQTNGKKSNRDEYRENSNAKIVVFPSAI